MWKELANSKVFLIYNCLLYTSKLDLLRRQIATLYFFISKGKFIPNIYLNINEKCKFKDRKKTFTCSSTFLKVCIDQIQFKNINVLHSVIYIVYKFQKLQKLMYLCCGIYLKILWAKSFTVRKLLHILNTLEYKLKTLYTVHPNLANLPTCVPFCSNLANLPAYPKIGHQLWGSLRHNTKKKSKKQRP